MCLLSCKILHRYSCLEILKERNILLNDRTVSLRSPDSHPPEVTLLEMLSYLAQNVILCSVAPLMTHLSRLLGLTDSLRNMIYYKKLYFSAHLLHYT